VLPTALREDPVDSFQIEVANAFDSSPGSVLWQPSMSVSGGIANRLALVTNILDRQCMLLPVARNTLEDKCLFCLGEGKIFVQSNQTFRINNVSAGFCFVRPWVRLALFRRSSAPELTFYKIFVRARKETRADGDGVR